MHCIFLTYIFHKRHQDMFAHYRQIRADFKYFEGHELTQTTMRAAVSHHLKAVPVQAMSTYRRSSNTAPLILICGTICRWLVSFTPCPLSPQGRTPTTHWIGSWYSLRLKSNAIEIPSYEPLHKKVKPWVQGWIMPVRYLVRDSAEALATTKLPFRPHP
jgi:hypothetical protein